MQLYRPGQTRLAAGRGRPGGASSVMSTSSRVNTGDCGSSNSSTPSPVMPPAEDDETTSGSRQSAEKVKSSSNTQSNEPAKDTKGYASVEKVSSKSNKDDGDSKSEDSTEKKENMGTGYSSKWREYESSSGSRRTEYDKHRSYKKEYNNSKRGVVNRADDSYKSGDNKRAAPERDYKKSEYDKCDEDAYDENKQSPKYAEEVSSSRAGSSKVKNSDRRDTYYDRKMQNSKYYASGNGSSYNKERSEAPDKESYRNKKSITIGSSSKYCGQYGKYDYQDYKNSSYTKPSDMRKPDTDVIKTAVFESSSLSEQRREMKPQGKRYSRDRALKSSTAAKATPVENDIVETGDHK